MRFNFVKSISTIQLHPMSLPTSKMLFMLCNSRDFKRLVICTALATVLMVSGHQNVEAQRNITYETLVQQADQPNAWTGQLVLPGSGGESLSMVYFRMDYDLLPFRRVRSVQERPSEELEFQATARLNMEVFRDNRVVTRDSWSDTVWAESYEQTRSREEHLEGAMATTLEPGQYRLRLELNRSDTPSGRPRQSQSRRPFDESSRERGFEVPDFTSHETGTMVLLERAVEESDSYRMQLLNYGESVLYGKDYQLLILLPEQPENGTFQLTVERLRSGSNSDTEGSPIYETTLSSDDLIFTDGFETVGDSTPELQFNLQESGFPLLILDIPNSQFPNARFKVTLTSDDREDPLATTVIHSRWIDMPVSLLNLDVAIDMLRFITEDQELRSMRRGSASEREARFVEFWKERDPTPNTEFNELMTEYYSRIDYTYENFTTPDRAGYESDQGRAYIIYGEPDRKERQYPPNGPTREIWEYGNRTLVFEATTGFGDFRLVQQR